MAHRPCMILKTIPFHLHAVTTPIIQCMVCMYVSFFGGVSAESSKTPPLPPVTTMPCICTYARKKNTTVETPSLVPLHERAQKKRGGGGVSSSSKANGRSIYASIAALFASGGPCSATLSLSLSSNGRLPLPLSSAASFSIVPFLR